MSELIEPTTLQDQAEAYWRKLLPELPADLLTRLAFNFGPARRVTATDHKRRVAVSANAELGREAFIESTFDDLIFQPETE